MHSTAATRAAARDYWNSPRAARLARSLEWITAALMTAAIMFAGSLNF